MFNVKNKFIINVKINFKNLYLKLILHLDFSIWFLRLLKQIEQFYEFFNIDIEWYIKNVD